MNALSGVLRIFRKDLVHWRSLAAGFVALLAALCWWDAGLPASGSGLLPESAEVEIPFLLACLFLTAKVIHADGPAGDCPYWVTRPVSGRCLLAAKLLWLAVCVNLPVLVAQACVLASNGLSPFDHFALLAWRQVFFTASVLLPAAALAAVTENLSAFATASLLYLVISRLPQWLAPAADRWLGWEWIRLSATAAVSLAAAALVLWLQFVRRQTEASRWVLGSAALAMGLVQFLPWQAGFALQSALARAPGRLVRINFAPGRIPAPAAARGPDPAAVGLEIPFQVSGLSADQGVRVEGVRILLDWPSGLHWDSGWGAAGEPLLYGADGSPRVVLPSDGPYWLRLAVAPEFYRGLQSSAVRLRASFALTLPGDSTSTGLNLGGATIAGDAVCSTGGADATLSVVCSTPFWRLARATLRVRSQSTGESMARDLLAGRTGAWTYGPYPTAVGLSLWANPLAADLNAPPLPIEVVLETHPPAGFAVRTVEVTSIRLPAYRIP